MIKKLVINKTDNTLIQLFRYTFVGGIAFAADFGTLYFLTDIVKCYYLYSAAIGFIIGLIINYILSIIWVFKYKALENRSVEFIFFAVIGLVGLGLNEIIIWFSTEQIKLYYLTSKLISTAIVYFWNFFARKYFLFKGKKSE